MSDERSDDGRAEDTAWQELVSQLRSESAPLPFAGQWARYQAIFARRRLSDGPPLAWQPGDRERDASNLAWLVRAVGMSDYRALHRWSVANRSAFWAKVIDRLGIRFREPPHEILEASAGPTRPQWLPGARLNIVDSCFQAPADATAIVHSDESSDTLRSLSYGALEQLVNRVASGLRRRGHSPRDSIALYMPMTVECVAAYLGIVRAGLQVVSIADSFSAAEVARRLAITGTRMVITVDSYRRAGKGIELYDRIQEAGVARAIVVPADAGTPPSLLPGDLLWQDLLVDEDGTTGWACDPYDTTNVLFSSGTTGEPKAIPWTHLTPIKCAMDGHFHHDIRPGDVVAWPTNIGWMMGPWLIFATLINRATMALYGGAPVGQPFTDFVARSGVTMLGVVPALVRAWRSADVPGFDGWSRVRALSSTGEPSNREDYLWLMSRCGYRAPIIEYLGGTEVGGGHVTGSVLLPASPATFTTPALGLDVVVLGADHLPVSEGEEGEMYLVPPSIGLSQSLLNRDHDAVYYEGCPTGPNGATLRRHGDQMATLAHGFFRAQGRADDTMNLGGIKVSSLELERAIDGHPAVAESAAVAVQVAGEGAERLVVFVVATSADRATLKKEIGQRLASELNPLFKIHDLLFLERLPRTASNKVMRRELRARYGKGESSS